MLNFVNMPMISFCINWQSSYLWIYYYRYFYPNIMMVIEIYKIFLFYNFNKLKLIKSSVYDRKRWSQFSINIVIEIKILIFIRNNGRNLCRSLPKFTGEEIMLIQFLINKWKVLLYSDNNIYRNYIWSV